MTTTEIPRLSGDLSDEPARSRWNWPVALLMALAAVPVVSMIVEVLRSPGLNFLDYWPVLGLASHPSGQFHLAGLFVLYNGHPVVIAGTLFWLDAKFLGGSNQALGLLVVVLSLVVVAGMASMLPRRLGAAVRAALVAGFAFLVFSPGNLENFGEGMSGTHWLSGLAPAIVAIALAHRGRTVPALILGVIACFGHGAAFPVWVALALIAWLRGDRRWQVIAPIVIAVLGVVGAAIAYATLPNTSSIPTATFALDRLLAVTSGVLGVLWSTQTPELAVLFGVISLIALVVAVVLVVSRVRRSPEPGSDVESSDNAGWTGLSAHIVLVAIMVGLSRAGVADSVGESGRYAVISGLAASAVLAMTVLLWRQLAVAPAVVIAVTIGLVTFTLGSAQATNVRNQYPGQTVLAVAMRLDAKNTMASLRVKDSILPAAKGLGAYPFTSDFTLGCGGPELGAKLDVSAAPLLTPNGTSGGYVESGKVVGDTMLSGWAVVDGRSPDCVLVVDDQNNVVGGGYVGLPRPDVAAATHTTAADAGWHAVAAANATNPQVVAMAGGKAYRLPVAPKQ
ncbi:hypothetical protein [Kutzneria sp. 744]|uniref:hypothetical protein n=1 Tax=Kutzneria sp. (strain 744) TaxID=345341 RepID=UPI0003EEC68E|nr:hypothetical protein [Kutzneria sp. 744]EWM14782.1 LigA protein [Kutzneria sp. 744]